MTYPASTTSCLNRFKSKIAGTVGLWLARLVTSKQVHFTTPWFHDLSNFKIWSCTFASTIACAPSGDCAIWANA
jgi:hypothetical protein